MELIGIKNTVIKKVKLEDCANYYGSGSLEVLATPALVKEMELAANSSLEGKIENGFTTVGTNINVKHLKASKPGTEIKTIATIVKVDGKKIFFEIESFENDKKIGIAEHTRYIVNVEEFMK